MHVLFGKYWVQGAEQYPRRAVHPAVHEQPRLVPYAQGQRVWLISADDQFFLQLQSDRFYFNWRKRGPAYPRFRDHDGQGLRSRALREFERFTAFCSAEVVESPRILRTEVTKIDRVPYTDAKDLAGKLRVATALQPAWRSEVGELSVTFSERFEDVDVLVRANNVLVGASGETPTLQVETRASRLRGQGDLVEELDGLNNAANVLFEAMFTPEAIADFTGSP
jgi:uncharacterized protein (TIGR04255 family)